MYYGVHYEYPFGGMCKRPEWRPHSIADYILDLDMIKDTGFNSLRIRIGFDSDLDDVETLIDLAYERNIKIMFGFATFYVNDDFVKTYPDSKIIGTNGDVIPIDEKDLRWQRACIDHPVYRQQRNSLISHCAQRFADHPAIIAWCVHNEPSTGPIRYPCYCQNTLNQYRQDLIARYQSIQAVNRQFDASFTLEEDITPPHSYCENNKMWLDWRDFMARNLSKFLNEGRDIIRNHVGKEALITYNLTEPYHIGNYGIDWWNIKGYNLKSQSMYMDSTEFCVAKDLSDSAILKSFREVGQQSWVTEFQGGAMPVPGRRTLYTSDDIDLSMNSIVANDVKGVFIYRWEPLLSGPEPMINGLVEADYYDTGRRLGMKKTLADLKKYSAILDEGHSLKARVAIYYNREQLLQANVKEQSDLFREAIQGAYGLFTDLGYEVTFIHNAFRSDCGYDLVVFPYLDDSDVDTGEIKKYVMDGGTAIIDLPAFAGIETARAVSQQFGVNCIDRQTLNYGLFAGWDLREQPKADGKFAGYAIDHRILLDGSRTETSLFYGDNGQCAIVIPEAYNGRLLVSGFGLCYSYGRTLHHGVRNYVSRFLASQIEPDVKMTGINPELRPYLEARVIQSRDKKLLFIINRCSLEFDLGVKLRGEEAMTLKIKPYCATKYLY